MLDPKAKAAIYHENIEAADCGVIALQSVTGLPYDDAAALLTAHGYGGGADLGTGTPRGAIEAALTGLGYSVERIEPEYNSTPSTFWMERRSGRFLLYTDSHVSAIVNGNPYNAGVGGKPLLAITKVNSKEDD